MTRFSRRWAGLVFWCTCAAVGGLLLLVYLPLPDPTLPGGPAPNHGGGRGGERFPEPRAEGWTVHRGCRHIAGEYHDGDSFMLETDAGRLVFRLYFVDAPENDRRFPDRNAVQARHFGIDESEVERFGAEARALAARFLRHGCTVYTRGEDARGSSGLPRSYALIEARGELLSEALLRAGLARAYGRACVLPDGTAARPHWDRLNELESQARQAGHGAWPP